MKQFLEQDPRFGGRVTTVAFVGDSLTAMGDWAAWFPEVETLNQGVNGNTTDDLLERLGEVIDAAPDEIVLLIGTNDLSVRMSVEHLVRNIQLMLVELRRALPGTRTLVQSIMPREREMFPQVHEANIHLRQFAPTVRAQYLDLWTALATADGALDPNFSDDRLHLNDAGYQAWLAQLRPALELLRELPPMGTPIRLAG